MSQRFRSRSEAGELLAQQLMAYAGARDTIVLALPRGGVPIGYTVATALNLPLDIFNVRKLGVPGREELAMGAIGSGGICYLNRDVIEALNIDPREVDAVIAREQREIDQRERSYRGGGCLPNLEGRRVILVDDGIATGATMFAAIEALRTARVREIIAAIPVGPPETCERLRAAADAVVCLRAPDPFYAVGAWYADFSQVGDDEVRALLSKSAARE